MKKIFQILVLSMLAIAISNISVQGVHALMGGGPSTIGQEDWQTKYYELKAEYDKLVGIIVPQLEVVASRVEEMRSELETVRSELETVRSELATSQADYSALDVKYQTALRDLNTRTTLMYVFIVTTVAFVATTLYLALRKRRS